VEALQEHGIHCPYCGEPVKVLVDTSVQRQQYIEDCRVCCRPILFDVVLDLDGSPHLEVSREDD